MTDATDVRIEASGETVGEAKWSALRELERLVPGLDREQVEFEILAEGERGLLGVGYSPARVIAKAPGGDAARTEASGPANDAREFVERIATAIGATVTVSASERDGVVTVTCSGEDLGLFIGKHGQTIDAIQYLANAVVRAEGEEHAVVVDAAGYRARRASVARSGREPIRAPGISYRLRGRARPDDADRAQDRARGAEGRSRGRDAERGLRAEPLRRRPAAALRRLT